MKQKTEVYNNADDAIIEIDFEAENGWFVHSMISTRLEELWRIEKGDNDRVLVVYRKDEE